MASESNVQQFPRRQPEGEALAEALRAIAEALDRAERLLAQAQTEQTKPPGPLAALSRLEGRLDELAAAQAALAARIEGLLDRVAALEGGDVPPAGPDLPPPEFIAKPVEERAPAPRAIEVTVSGVDGFEGLMELQRAVLAVPGVVSAPVLRFHGGSAALTVTLDSKVDVEDLAPALTAFLGRAVEVESVGDEALALRVASDAEQPVERPGSAE